MFRRPFNQNFLVILHNTILYRSKSSNETFGTIQFSDYFVHGCIEGGGGSKLAEEKN